MNYIAIIILALLVIFLMNNKRVYTIKEAKPDENIIKKIQYIKNNIEIVKKTKIKNIKDLENKILSFEKEYILLSDIDNLSDDDKEEMILNYIINGEKTCGFKFQYSYCGSGNIFKRLLSSFIIACVNYVEMLTKQNLHTFTCIISKKEEILQDVQKKKIGSFVISNNLKICLNIKSLKSELLSRHKLNFSSIISVFFTIIAGSIVTANILYNVVNIFGGKTTFYEIISCILIYVSYASVTVKVYNPMGRFRIIASYLFPIYIVIYIILSSYYFIGDILKRYNMKSKKNFLISLLILFVVYLVFILIKK